jgi:hypothetical protein
MGRSQKHEPMSRRAAVLLVAILGSFAPARAADVPSGDWKYENPFCQVVALVAPIPAVVASTAPVGGDSRYALELFASDGRTLAAHVTLVSDTDAYDATVPKGTLADSSEGRSLGPVIVTLPAPDTITYFFVDSYSLDGGAGVTCPSYVFQVSQALSGAPAGVPSVDAQHLQKIGPLKCGSAYLPPQMHGDLESPVGAYGGRPVTAVTRAFIDSNGYAIRQQIVQSSGVDGIDKYLLGAVGVHQFTPAQFLCVPVVGTVDVELKYFP